ncbi:3-oxoacyl-[acyl-carrier-protein] synthase III [Amycolatopsis mediterranei S699]|uniref:Beta-ketoacyl-[acyl-carrier-protein] synthase III n=2 Tax=Amycolatopsis mediterranei TaxID=33910 RepID=A0A0H3CZ47_AMYMU|nr:beta-ketoacyl-ACP synthase III [Amycolatopsis mediterranei]ADJ43907.1 3-oxoacyl-[acyl-carrier-protein] synthase III [Amycolatopsis mediterranei U32]AEK40626.1 3-oxoacyl-(acyl-carrier-protein) synthase III [Amycolatopsis mediterranei S699]AFO75620.1 3-oxoacyl-[acyl-carrier-protein] synthase III [Amycolatopsis mediterranei S699]AGT82749.1 3-oxoacyl-[acyl-carrier-protein] synthase III [Amycolatopsis mediterranei RB]KDO09085.1 3-oxoacyl-ACP synthase [Amycolatopsis mediterranei]
MTDRPALSLNPGSRGSRVLGIGSAQPEKIVTNDDLSKFMETSDEWIQSRVGIIERRFAEKDESLTDFAVAAGKAALEDAGVDPSEVDTVILPNCTMPTLIPNAAAQVAARIGIPSPGAFDLNAACAGFCYGLGVASDLIRAGSAKKVLVIGAEKLTDSVDPTDRANAIIFADGAGAAVVGASDEPEIGPVSWGSAGDLVDLIYMRDDKYIYQEGQSVFRWATTKIAPIAMQALEVAGLKPSDVDVLIPHQANLRIVEAIAKKLRANGAREDMVVADDIKYSGNTSSASIPLALDHMRKAGTAKPGDVVLAVGFGAGLSYAGQAFICP